MAGQKISLLPLATVLLPTDQMAIARGGITLRLPGDALVPKTQHESLKLEVNLKAPLLSAQNLYTKVFQISSAIRSTAATYSYVSEVTSYFNETYLTQFSAGNTFIFKPIPTQPLKSGNLLTWNGEEWTEVLAIENFYLFI